MKESVSISLMFQILDAIEEAGVDPAEALWSLEGAKAFLPVLRLDTDQGNASPAGRPCAQLPAHTSLL
jgi:hypothetical protein